MKTIALQITSITLLFLTSVIYSQGKTNNQADLQDQVNYSKQQNYEYKNPFTFKIGTGVLLPQNTLKEYFGISPIVELEISIRISKKKSVGLSLQTIIPNQKESFKYIRDIDTIQAKATVIMNPLLRFKRHLVKTTRSDLNIQFGIGASIIQTNARNPYYEGNEKQNKYESITSFLATTGIEYSYSINGEEFFIGFDIQYAPYRVEGALREDIGTYFYVPKISYKF